MAKSESYRAQAVRLFALAIEARDKGNTLLADLLTEAAARFLDQAISIEKAEGAGTSPAPIHDAPPTLQQQQVQKKEE